MRKHGWQLPYHPLQVVAVSVFLALGFAFYVFFVPFVGGKLIQYVVMGLYTPLVTCVFFLYIWCAATDPGDLGVFESKKYRHKKDNHKKALPKESKQGDLEAHHASAQDKPEDESVVTVATATTLPNGVDRENTSCYDTPFSVVLLGLWPLSCLCSRRSSEKQAPQKEAGEEDGMFYCSLCEVEVLKYSKHCRVCDKCVDSFDHHCRWINNCIGKRNYRGFFVLMVSALLLLILQWSIGVLVLILCFIRRKQYSVEITSKLGSSFSLAPFVVVVASCTFLAIVATLPLAQLFFFHVLLIKKGISTYDYIVALREQDQQTVGQQSPQMSSVSSFTALSSTSSFNAFHRGGWCTPPRLFLEDQFDVVPPEISMSSGNSAGKRMMPDESTRKKNAGTVKISPWALARLNTEEVSKAAAQARKKSRVLQPVVRREKPLGKEMDNSFSHGSSQKVMWPDNRRRTNKRVRLPMELPLEPLAKVSASVTDSNSSELAPETSTSLAPLQLEARTAFRPTRAAPTGIVASPDSSLDSPDLHPFRISTSGAEESQGLSYVPSVGTASQKGIQLSRSTSDGYDASGGEDSDRVPSRIVHRTSNWASLIVGSGNGNDDVTDKLKASGSVGIKDDTRQI